MVTTITWGDVTTTPARRAFSLDSSASGCCIKLAVVKLNSRRWRWLWRLSRVRGDLMAASVWSGYLTFGLISMPVRLFSGARSSGISFNMLHRPDLQRVKQQYYCPADNRVVERSEIVKGYEFRKDEYVVIEPEEIKKIEPQTAKTMEIL